MKQRIKIIVFLFYNAFFVSNVFSAPCIPGTITASCEYTLDIDLLSAFIISGSDIRISGNKIGQIPLDTISVSNIIATPANYQNLGIANSSGIATTGHPTIDSLITNSKFVRIVLGMFPEVPGIIDDPSTIGVDETTPAVPAYPFVLTNSLYNISGTNAEFQFLHFNDIKLVSTHPINPVYGGIIKLYTDDTGTSHSVSNISNVFFTYSNITSQTAIYGGIISLFNNDATNTNTLSLKQIENSIFSGNKIENTHNIYGGIIDLQKYDGTFSISNSIFSNNFISGANIYGGILNFIGDSKSGNITIGNTIFSGNFINSTSATRGGIINAQNVTIALIANSVFARNTIKGGSLINTNENINEIFDSTFSDNTIDSGTVLGSIINFNTLTDNFTFKNSVIKNNIINGSSTALIYITDSNGNNVDIIADSGSLLLEDSNVTNSLHLKNNNASNDTILTISAINTDDSLKILNPMNVEGSGIVNVVFSGQGKIYWGGTNTFSQNSTSTINITNAKSFYFLGNFSSDKKINIQDTNLVFEKDSVLDGGHTINIAADLVLGTNTNLVFNLSENYALTGAIPAVKITGTNDLDLTNLTINNIVMVGSFVSGDKILFLELDGGRKFINYANLNDKTKSITKVTANSIERQKYLKFEIEDEKKFIGSSKYDVKIYSTGNMIFGNNGTETERIFTTVNLLTGGSLVLGKITEDIRIETLIIENNSNLYLEGASLNTDSITIAQPNLILDFSKYNSTNTFITISGTGIMDLTKANIILTSYNTSGFVKDVEKVLGNGNVLVKTGRYYFNDYNNTISGNVFNKRGLLFDVNFKGKFVNDIYINNAGNYIVDGGTDNYNDTFVYGGGTLTLKKGADYKSDGFSWQNGSHLTFDLSGDTKNTTLSKITTENNFSPLSLKIANYSSYKTGDTLKLLQLLTTTSVKIILPSNTIKISTETLSRNVIATTLFSLILEDNDKLLKATYELNVENNGGDWVINSTLPEKYNNIEIKNIGKITFKKDANLKTNNMTFTNDSKIHFDLTGFDSNSTLATIDNGNSIDLSVLTDRTTQITVAKKDAVLKTGETIKLLNIKGGYDFGVAISKLCFNESDDCNVNTTNKIHRQRYFEDLTITSNILQGIYKYEVNVNSNGNIIFGNGSSETELKFHTLTINSGGAITFKKNADVESLTFTFNSDAKLFFELNDYSDSDTHLAKITASLNFSSLNPAIESNFLSTTFKITKGNASLKNGSVVNLLSATSITNFGNIGKICFTDSHCDPTNSSSIWRERFLKDIKVTNNTLQGTYIYQATVNNTGNMIFGEEGTETETIFSKLEVKSGGTLTFKKGSNFETETFTYNTGGKISFDLNGHNIKNTLAEVRADIDLTGLTDTNLKIIKGNTVLKDGNIVKLLSATTLSNFTTIPVFCFTDNDCSTTNTDAIQRKRFLNDIQMNNTYLEGRYVYEAVVRKDGDMIFGTNGTETETKLSSLTIGGNLTLKKDGNLETKNLVIEEDSSFYYFFGKNKNPLLTISTGGTINKTNLTDKSTLTLYIDNDIMKKGDRKTFTIFDGFTSPDDFFTDKIVSNMYKVIGCNNGKCEIERIKDSSEVLKVILDTQLKSKTGSINTLKVANTIFNETDISSDEEGTKKEMIMSKLNEKLNFATITGENKADNEKQLVEMLQKIAPDIAKDKEKIINHNIVSTIFTAVGTRIKGYFVYNKGKIYEELIASANNFVPYRVYTESGSAWGQALYNYSENTKGILDGGWKNDSSGFAIGYDGFTDVRTIGGISYAYTRSKFVSSRETDINSHTFLLYGQLKSFTGYFLNGLLSYTMSANAQTRDIDGVILSDNYESNTTAIQLGVGKEMKTFATSVFYYVPSLSLKQITTQTGKYTDELGQTIKTGSNKNLSAIVNIDFINSIRLSQKSAVAVTFKLNVEQDLSKTANSYSVSFDNGASYSIEGEKTLDLLAGGGFEFNYSIDDNKQNYILNVDAKAKKDYIEFGVTATVKFKF
ncbi:MAG: hypothetical protein Ta2D_04160 [Rickettsiales bacterium]|nr:MAG: hypothetical protein Ta2D_04160 [Rickettsiales bacterium]